MKGEFSAVSNTELASRITALAGQLNAENARFLALVAELERRRGVASGQRERDQIRDAIRRALDEARVTAAPSLR